MSAIVSLAVSLHQGRAIRDHIEDLSLAEGRHTKLTQRMVVQARTATATATILANVAHAAGRIGLEGRAAFIPLVVLGIEGTLALVSRCLGTGSQAASVVGQLRRLMPRVTAVGLVAATLALALLQPLAAIGLVLHGIVALAERRQWISAKAVSALLIATSVVGLGLGLVLGSPLIKALVIVEVVAFIARRLATVKERLGLVSAPPAESHSHQAARALTALGVPATGQPISWDQLINPLPALEQQVAGALSGLRSSTSPSLWELHCPDIHNGRIRSIPLSDWTTQVRRIRERLISWNQRLESRRERERLTSELLAGLHRVQRNLDQLKGGMEQRFFPNNAQCRDGLLNSLDDLLQQIQHMPGEVQREVPNAFPESELDPLRRSIHMAVARTAAEELGELERKLTQQSQSLRSYVDGAIPSWISDEVAAAAAELPHHAEGSVSAILEGLDRLNQQFLAGDFGPGSITSPASAQRGWGRCLQAMDELLLLEEHHMDEADDAQRQAVALRAIAQLVVKTRESCSGAVLCAIEECFDTLRGVDRLAEGFVGFLRRVGTEEAADWERNTVMVRWPRRVLEGLADIGLPGAQRLRAYIGRPDANTAIAGAARMPWLSTSQTSALSLLRRSPVMDLEIGILATQLLGRWLSHSKVHSRLRNIRLMVDQAVHFLLTPEGRRAWHSALGRSEFREWIQHQVPALRDQLDQLALPSAEELEQLMQQQRQPFGVQQGEVMPQRLWVAAILLLDYCDLLTHRPAR